MKTSQIDAREVMRSLVAPLFEPDESLLDALTAHLRHETHPAGTMLYRAGERCEDMLILAHGLARAFYVDEDKEINLRLLCEPSIVMSLASFITKAPAEEWIEAITPVEVYRADFRRLERAQPELGNFLGRQIAERHYLSLERRLRMLQHKSVAQRYAYFCTHMEAPIVERTPAYHVASYLGVAPETLSRVRRSS